MTHALIARASSLLAVASLALALGGQRAGASPAASCDASAIHTEAYPGWPAAPRLPWIETYNGHIAGLLFFTVGNTGDGALLHPHGRMPNGAATKILWYVKARGGGRNLVVSGKELDGADTVRQSFPRALSPPNNYPAIVDVPAAGCWRLDLKGGTVRGTVVMRVVDSG